MHSHEHVPHAVTIRPAMSRDAGELVAMFDRCRPESRYARFLSPVARFPPGHLHDVLNPDGTRWSWVACDPGAPRVVALVSLFRSAPSAGELGLLVEDGRQRQGIGTALLRFAAARACDVGIDTLTAVSLTASRHVRVMLERLGTVTSRGDGLTTEHAVRVCTHLPHRVPA